MNPSYQSSREKGGGSEIGRGRGVALIEDRDEGKLPARGDSLSCGKISSMAAKKVHRRTAERRGRPNGDG